MTIHDLRRLILIDSFDSHEEGATIHYYKKNILYHLLLNTDQLSDELKAIGSIKSKDQVPTYHISQWDAINLAIRHEYQKSEKRWRACF